MSERVWGIASYGLVGVAALAAGAYIAWRCEVDSSTIASWVQAIGSIAAIAGSFLLGQWQAERSARDQAARLHAEEVRAVDGMVQSARTLVSACRRTQRKLRGERTIVGLPFTTFAGLESLASTALKALEAIPIHEAVYAPFMRDLVVIKTYAVAYVELVKKCQEQGFDQTEDSLRDLDAFIIAMRKGYSNLHARACAVSETRRRALRI
ncbi:hypothetical protein N234_31820 [Ralstonia pickettii DTP0602]|nr:hypothetical protein N234_31820 [Ralstonia pickettii DTP0602]